MTDGPDHPPSSPDARADLRRARRRFLAEAAIEAEKETGRREKTDDEARHSLWGRLARLVGGWILVLLGLAAIPLPGPGWLMVLLGLTLLPYRWTDNLIRVIRRRIPGIPEDGRIPTRTWVVTGLLVVLATGASVWWGLRDEGSDDTRQEARAAASAPRPVRAATLPDDARGSQLAGTYAAVAATVDGARTEVRESADPCEALKRGRVDLIVPTLAEATACFGGTTADEVRAAADTAGAKVFAPVTIDAVTYLPTARHDRIAVDDEPTELAIDGVSGVLNGGATVTGEPTARAKELMRTAGVLK
ncbi:MAG: PGPGW domain-containing protein [Acidimicrobiales bacterium]